jgi:hypothetical protein
MDLAQFLVIGLATWRILNFIYDDRWAGPFDLLHKLRYAIGIRYDDKNRRASVAKPVWKRELATMHNCPYCMSFWYGLAATMVWILVPAEYRHILLAIAMPFALSAFVSITQKVTR